MEKIKKKRKWLYLLTLNATSFYSQKKFDDALNVTSRNKIVIPCHAFDFASSTLFFLLALTLKAKFIPFSAFSMFYEFVSRYPL